MRHGTRDAEAICHQFTTEREAHRAHETEAGDRAHLERFPHTERPPSRESLCTNPRRFRCPAMHRLGDGDAGREQHRALCAAMLLAHRHVLHEKAEETGESDRLDPRVHRFERAAVDL